MSDLIQTLQQKIKQCKQIANNGQHTIRSIQYVSNGLDNLMVYVRKEIVRQQEQNRMFRNQTSIEIAAVLMQWCHQVFNTVKQMYGMSVEINKQMQQRQNSIQGVVKQAILTAKAIQDRNRPPIRIRQPPIYQNQPLNTIQDYYRVFVVKAQKLSHPQQKDSFKNRMLQIQRQNQANLQKIQQQTYQSQISQMLNVLDQCLRYVFDTEYIRELAIIKSIRKYDKFDKEDQQIKSMYLDLEQFEKSVVQLALQSKNRSALYPTVKFVDSQSISIAEIPVRQRASKDSKEQSSLVYSVQQN